DLVPTLKALGLNSAFSQSPGGANFQRMAASGSNGPLAITDVFHQAVLALDEERTEGAASTAVNLSPLSATAFPPRPIEVHIDKPFLLVVQHRITGACVFLAQISDPR